jgi:hypothetical protein
MWKLNQKNNDNDKELDMFKKIVLAAVGIAILLIIISIIILIALKSPIDPVAYSAPEKPAMTGVLEHNDLLQKAELLAKGKVNGPDEIAVDEKGRIYFGTPAGTISRLLSNGVIETFTTTGGRPLGMKFDKKGNLIVADANKGLLSVDPPGLYNDSGDIG